MRVLVLGGTGEARALASALVAGGVEVVSSLAGRVREPQLPEGPVRMGGFGGPVGLAEFLRAENFTGLVDATHPFAAAITANAAVAACRAGVPRLVLRRPGWPADPSWHGVGDLAAAAEVVHGWAGEVVFLSTGRGHLGVFAGDARHRFLVRAVDPPDGPVPPRTTVLLDRGPYTLDGERTLLRDHGVGLLVTRDSGGELTEAKLRAARELGVAVVMVARPPLPEGSAVVATVEQAVAWIAAVTGRA